MQLQSDLCAFLGMLSGTVESSKVRENKQVVSRGQKRMNICYTATIRAAYAPVAQRYHVTSDTLGREFDPGKRDFSH